MSGVVIGFGFRLDTDPYFFMSGEIESLERRAGWHEKRAAGCKERAQALRAQYVKTPLGVTKL